MSSANSSLRPAWRNQSGGKGFQPPPSVNSGKGRSSSIGSSTEGSEKSEGRIYNKFSALDDDDDFEVVRGGPPSKSRLEGLRQGLAVRSASSGTKPGGSGRSLADLAATVPEKAASSSSSNRFARDENVIRFTREKLLSMRPQPKGEVPEVLRELHGTVVLAENAQDPVCFDVFDADAIWAAVPVRRPSSVKLTRESSQGEVEPRRSSARTSGTGGRWQRGVALPPPSATTSSTGKTKEIIADNPEDLWDDPVAASGAATDFSAFRDLGDGEQQNAGDVFDFEKMAEESRLLENELHPVNEANTGKGPANGLPRPLSVVGTTIQSGSGDDVNVFEDFDDPAAEPATPPTETTTPESTQEPAPVKSATQDPTASSRLMAMIGVNPDRSNETEGLSLAALVGGTVTSTAPASVEASVAGAPTALKHGWGGSSDSEPAVNGLNIPLNPWGDSSLLGGPVAPTSTIPAPSAHDMDIQARLREAEMEQKAREQLRRQQEMEAQKRAQQQQEQQRQDSQRQQGVQSQVELVLMERIASILERSWGRSDLISILTALHAEDPRVVPLLNNVDALRALLNRNTSRVRVQHDPAFGTEVAVLVVTNSQWQEQQASRAQQEEMRRRIQQQEEQQKQQAQRQREESAARSRRSFRPDAPWFYSDPQGNIQGPFRSEEMRQWLMAGYFKGDLPVCQDPNGPFLALSSVFPDLNNAFVFGGDQPPQHQSSPQAYTSRAEEEKARRAAEQKEREARERAAAEAAEQERRKREVEEQESERLRRAAAVEAERKARAEKQAAERQAHTQRQSQDSASAKSSNTNGGNESSTQLKMMLGLGGGGIANSHGAVFPATPASTPVAPRSVVDTKVDLPKRKSTSSNPPAPPIESQPSAPKPVPPAASPWGSASQPSRKKTMDEIQKEEARAAALAAMRQESSRPSGSGWANVAASKGGTSGWNSGAVRTAPAAVLGRPQIAQPTAPSPISVGGKNLNEVAALNMQTAPPPQQGKGGKNSPADAFGAKMSPALEKWCKEQMMKLNGTDDLTLVSFCMTLNDPGEIRQYLTAYLGTGSQINNFATEFIHRKVGVTPARDEWESTVTTKKKSKKKTAK